MVGTVIQGTNCCQQDCPGKSSFNHLRHVLGSLALSAMSWLGARSLHGEKASLPHSILSIFTEMQGNLCRSEDFTSGLLSNH